MYKNYRRERLDFTEILPAVPCNKKAGEIKKFLKKHSFISPKVKCIKITGGRGWILQKDSEQ
jgi:hypothetical protein